MNEAIGFFPSLKNLITGEKATRNTSLLMMPGRPAGIHALDLVNTLLRSPFDAELTNLYFQYKVREYLLLLLKEASQNNSSRLNLTRRELSLLAELKTQLISNPQIKFPIRKLAIETGMNTIKLDMAFKQQYGESIFSFHLSERMKEARRLLAETDFPIKAVAALVGYGLTTSFITKFREFFGYPPSQVKKKI